MSKISNRIAKQKHYNFVHDYGNQYTKPTLEFLQMRETPGGWMKRKVYYYPWYKKFGSWHRSNTIPSVLADKAWWTPLSLCKMKRMFKEFGMNYKP